MVTSKDNILSDTACEPPGTGGALRPTVDVTILALTRLLGRQTAQEAFRAARTDSQTADPAPATPATTTDEE